MNLLLLATPGPPTWRINYSSLEAEFDWLRALRSCPQDPVHHAEGDVGIHTEMVLQALCALPAFRALCDDDRQICFLACLLHDVAKPWTTQEADGRLTARGHSTKGATFARRLLWELGLPWQQREQVCALIRFHQVPFFLVDKDQLDAERRLLLLAESARPDLLAVVAEADLRGRICADQQRILDAIELFRVMSSDVGVVDKPYAFASDHARFRFFRDPRRTRFDEAFDDTRCEVTLLCGLPASGKDTWVRTRKQGGDVISLDDLRAEHDLAHGGSQRAVVELAREKLKQQLRQQRDVVWNATSLARDLRAGVIDIADAYHARVRIVCCEAGADTIEERNQQREQRVPAGAFDRMLGRWEFPDRSEAHQLDVVEN